MVSVPVGASTTVVSDVTAVVIVVVVMVAPSPRVVLRVVGIVRVVAVVLEITLAGGVTIQEQALLSCESRKGKRPRLISWPGSGSGSGALLKLRLNVLTVVTTYLVWCQRHIWTIYPVHWRERTC
jgi:hypothetical protein